MLLQLKTCFVQNNNNNNNNKLTFKNAQLTEIVTQAPVTTRKPSLQTEQKSLEALMCLLIVVYFNMFRHKVFRF